MAEFYRIHKKAIERAFNGVRVGDYFRITAWEPLAPPISGEAPKDDTVTILTFRRTTDGNYTPASDADRNAIAEWTARHKDTPAEAWELPDFSAFGGIAHGG